MAIAERIVEDPDRRLRSNQECAAEIQEAIGKRNYEIGTVDVRQSKDSVFVTSIYDGPRYEHIESPEFGSVGLPFKAEPRAKIVEIQDGEAYAIAILSLSEPEGELCFADVSLRDTSFGSGADHHCDAFTSRYLGSEFTARVGPRDLRKTDQHTFS